jgi:hypothetical protein
LSTDFSFPAHIQKQAEEARADIKDLKERVTKLETEGAVQGERVLNMQVSLSKIDNNTTWLVRLIIGAIICGVLAFALKGGFHVQ